MPGRRRYLFDVIFVDGPNESDLIPLEGGGYSSKRTAMNLIRAFNGDADAAGSGRVGLLLRSAVHHTDHGLAGRIIGVELHPNAHATKRLIMSAEFWAKRLRRAF